MCNVILTRQLKQNPVKMQSHVGGLSSIGATINTKGTISYMYTGIALYHRPIQRCNITLGLIPCTDSSRSTKFRLQAIRIRPHRSGLTIILANNNK